uniref:Uncharacterized protein n=1 Tax=Anguilla anguilla TaxID=7936 RepID=A0A0E9Q8J4_ANGAN
MATCELLHSLRNTNCSHVNAPPIPSSKRKALK